MHIVTDIAYTHDFVRDGGFYTAYTTDYFWHIWKEYSQHLKNKGIVCTKNQAGKFIVKVPLEVYTRIPKFNYVKESFTDLPEITKSDFLRPYQVNHVKHLIAAFPSGNIVDCSETGVGKTYCAIATAMEYDKKVFVITPKSVRNQWWRAIRNTGIEAVDVLNYEALKFGRSRYLSLVEEKNRKYFTWNLPADTVIVWDEAHRCKNHTTANAKMMLASVNQSIPGIALSATLADRPDNLGAIGPFLGLFKPEDYYKWIMSHGMYFKQYKPGARPALTFSGSKFHLYKIHSKIFPDHGHTVTKAELGDIFPSNLITADAVEMDNAGKIEKAIKQMRKELANLKKKTDKDKVGNPLTIRLRARQEVELLKVPTLVELAEDGLEEGNSVIIFVNFTETLESLQKHLKTTCVIYGDQDDTTRQRNHEDFQSNKSRIIILNTGAGGVGIDLHDTDGNHPRLVLLSPTDNARDLYQALGRAHRDGGCTPVVQRIIFAAGTVEEQVCEGVEKKLLHMEIINDGDLSLDR